MCVSLWKLFYNNDYHKFLTSWNSDDDDSIDKKTIIAEINSCLLANKVICLSNETVKDVVEIYKVSKSKIKLVPNGIGIEMHSQNKKQLDNTKKKIDLKSNDFILHFVGRLNHQKGVLQLITAFKKAQLKNPDIKLIVLGDGELLRFIKWQSRGIKDKILIMGYIKPDLVSFYYGLADVIIFPTLNEQSSYVVLEGMANKVPLIVTDIAAFEFLEDNVHCLKVDLVNGKKLNQKVLLNKIDCLVKDSKLGNNIAENAHKLYLKKFTANRMFESTYQ